MAWACKLACGARPRSRKFSSNQSVYSHRPNAIVASLILFCAISALLSSAKPLRARVAIQEPMEPLGTRVVDGRLSVVLLVLVALVDAI